MGSIRRVRDLIEALDRRAPFARAAHWDPVGLQLGDPDARLERLAVCHEVSPAVVDAVADAGVDLLLAYHPLLFEPTRSLVAGPGPPGRAWRLARTGVALAVAHTSWDVAPGGAADALAEALSLASPSGFAPLDPGEGYKLVTFLPAEAADPVLDALAAAGAGHIGGYSHCSYRGEGMGSFFAAAGTDPVVGDAGRLNLEPELRLEIVVPATRRSQVVAALLASHPYEEPAYDLIPRRPEAGLLGRVGRLERLTALADFASDVARQLDAPATRATGEPDGSVERVAVLPGAGGDQLEAALAAGAQVVVTGDVSHHRAQAALERGLALVDPGHAATERPGLQSLFAWAAAQGVETLSLLELDPEPWWRPEDPS